MSDVLQSLPHLKNGMKNVADVAEVTNTLVFAAWRVRDQSNHESTEPDKTQSDSFEYRWFLMGEKKTFIIQLVQ